MGLVYKKCWVNFECILGFMRFGCDSIECVSRLEETGELLLLGIGLRF